MSALNQARKAFDKIYQMSKEPVTVKSVTVARSAQDDESYTTTSYSGEAKVDRGMHMDFEGKGGELDSGQFIFYFPYDFTNGIDSQSCIGNYITYNSETYKITKIQPYNLADGLVYTRVYASQSNLTV